MMADDNHTLLRLRGAANRANRAHRLEVDITFFFHAVSYAFIVALCTERSERADLYLVLACVAFVLVVEVPASCILRRASKIEENIFTCRLRAIYSDRFGGSSVNPPTFDPHGYFITRLFEVTGFLFAVTFALTAFALPKGSPLSTAFFITSAMFATVTALGIAIVHIGWKYQDARHPYALPGTGRSM